MDLALSDSEDPVLKLHTRVHRLSAHPPIQIVIVLKVTESLIFRMARKLEMQFHSRAKATLSIFPLGNLEVVL